MGRTLKEHDVRKAELIDAAWELFKTNGYDSTPVSAIIDKVGVAKGTFYHYFSSKEEILDDAIARETAKVMDNLQPVLDDDSLSPVDKMKSFLSAFSAWKLQNASMLADIFRVIYKPENIVVREKMNRKTYEIVVPIMGEIIAGGVEEGCFDTICPEETAAMILNSSSTLAEQNIRSLYALQENPEEMVSIQRRIDFFQFMLQRLLGNSEIFVKGFGEDVVGKMRSYIQSQPENKSGTDDS